MRDRPLQPGHAPRSQGCPLTAQQESEILVRENGVSIVTGCIASHLNYVTNVLRATRSDYVRTFDDVSTSAVEAFQECLRDLRDRGPHGTTVLIVSDICKWECSWVNEALESLSRLKSRDSFGRVLFLADPNKVWSLLQTPDATLSIPDSKVIRQAVLQKWHDAAVRQWLTECGLQDDEHYRKQLKSVTGNWPEMLARFLRISQRDQTHISSDFGQLENELRDSKRQPDLHRMFAFDEDTLSIPLQVLSGLAEFGDAASSQGLQLLLDTVSPLDVKRSLRWAELLNYIDAAGERQWKCDSFVGTLLQGVSS